MLHLDSTRYFRENPNVRNEEESKLTICGFRLYTTLPGWKFNGQKNVPWPYLFQNSWLRCTLGRVFVWWIGGRIPERNKKKRKSDNIPCLLSCKHHIRDIFSAVVGCQSISRGEMGRIATSGGGDWSYSAALQYVRGASRLHTQNNTFNTENWIFGLNFLLGLFRSYHSCNALNVFCLFWMMNAALCPQRPWSFFTV